MTEFNNIASFKSANRFLNLREGTNDTIVFDIHENGSPVSHSIALTKAQVVHLMDVLIKKYGTTPGP